MTEEAKKETKTIYAVNKLACEGYLYAYRQSFDIPYTIFRICIPYGNLIEGDYSFGTVGFFLKMAQQRCKDITLYGGGHNKRTFTHMSDLCYQLIMASQKPESNGEIYNIGGEILSCEKLLNVLQRFIKSILLTSIGLIVIYALKAVIPILMRVDPTSFGEYGI